MADLIVIKKNFKYRLYPTATHILALDGQLAEACRLYNARCGLSVPRDNASALEILRLGLSLLGGTWPT